MADQFSKTLTVPSSTGEKSWRVSYPSVVEPVWNQDKTRQSYSCAFIIPAEDMKLPAVKELLAAILQAAKEMFPALDYSKGFPLGKLRCPIVAAEPNAKTGKFPAGTKAGDYLLKTSSNAEFKPGVVGMDLAAITDPKKVYGGCYACAEITVKAYDAKGGMGVSCYLNNFLKVKDGEPLGGSNGTPDRAFKPVQAAAAGGFGSQADASEENDNPFM